MKKPNPKSQTRISKITVARLYNLGNYEHVRYELTVDVPEGESAKIAMRNTVRVLKALNPKPPCSESEYLQAKKFIANPEEIGVGITNKKDRAKYRKEVLIDSKKQIAFRDAWDEQRKNAFMDLDSMGGVRVFSDAKEKWEDFE